MERHFILKQIFEIKALENGFSKNTMRWGNVQYNGTHISEIDFDALAAEHLVNIFKLIIKRYYIQM